MTVNIGRTKLKITAAFVVFTAACFLLGYGSVFAASLAALLAHECGHLFAAALFGIRIELISILPSGGQIVMESMPESGIVRCAIALAGPLSSFIFAAAIQGLAVVFSYSEGLELCVSASVVIMLINLVPSFPLDGGWVILEILKCFFRERDAVKICAVVSLVFAAIVIYISFIAYSKNTFNPTLLLMGMLMLAGGIKELRNKKYVAMISTYNRMKALKSRSGIKLSVVALGCDTTIRTARNALKNATLIVVMDDSMRFLGNLSEGDLINGMSIYGEQAKLAKLIGKSNLKF